MAGDYFRGFPALWNAVAFYFFLIKPPTWLAALLIAALAALTFAPLKFLASRAGKAVSPPQYRRPGRLVRARSCRARAAA